MTTPKRPRDPNQLAKFIVDAVTGEAVEEVKGERERQDKSAPVSPRAKRKPPASAEKA